ncbi:MAG: chitobiase/beta-hexosaminidase C-terminal domain-containing protein [Prevotella sp.]|nr:chitobiase/beta-hexosaminidase C-terminal domain-containing protein [Prevotella sp.]
MTKTLRFSLLSMLMMLCGSLFAQQVTLDFDNDYATLFPTIAGTSSNDSHDGDFTATTTSTAVSGVTVTVAPADDAKTPSRIWSSAPRLRMYSGTFTVSGKDITKIEFTGHNTNFSLSTSTGTLDGKTWTGKADQVVFEVSKNTQINKIVVTLGEGSDTPDPDPDPDPQVQTVANIAAFKALADGTEANLTLSNAEVLYVNGTNDIYVRDASGAIDFFRTGLTYTAGQKLNGSVIGKYSLYQNTPELAKTDNTNGDKISATSGTVTAKSISAADAKNNICDLVKLSSVSITENDGKYYVDDVQIYDKFKVVSGTPDVSKTYDIEGIIIMYNDVVEICPVKDYTDGTSPDPEPTGDRQYKKVTTVESGKAYLIVADNNGLKVAKPITASYGYLQVADVTDNNDAITQENSTNDFVITAVDGGYTIKQSDGRYLYQTGNYNSFNVAAEPADGQVWTITANGDGTFKIENASVNKWIQLDPSYGTYGSYNEEKGAMPYLYAYDGEVDPEPQPDVIEDATIAEFNAAAESTTVWYRLKGEVKNLKDGDQYGNFDLEDETGSVYVYGLLSEKGGAQKQFQELAAEKGIKNGCKITIIGNRGSYKDQIEVTNAYFVSVDEAAPAELVISGDTEFTESTTVTITPSDEIHDVYYTLDGSDPSDMAKATRYMGPFTITETCTVRAWEEDVNLFAEKTFTKAEPDKEYTVEEVIAAAPESTTATDGQQKVWVKGYIVGFVNGQALATGAVFGADGCETKTNLLLATDPAETNVENCIPVQLPAGNVRDDLNLQDHPDNNGKEVLLYGYILKYFSVPGFKNVSDYKFTGNSSVEMINAENVNDGKMYNLAGQRVNGSFKGIVIKNGKKFMVK